MFARLLLLFTLVPLVELYILIQLGARFGALSTIVLVIGTGVLGAYLARQQGISVWSKIRLEMQQGRFPADDLIDGLLVFIAGAVLLTPGLLTDILGFLILIPASRTVIRGWIKKKIQRMIQSGNITFRGLF